MDTRLVQMNMEYQLAKQQQEIQALANMGSICGGLRSDPSAMVDSLLREMNEYDSFIEIHRVVEITFWED